LSRLADTDSIAHLTEQPASPPALRHIRDLDLTRTSVLLCDADGNLFPSEEPAFEASSTVVNAFLAEYGVAQRFTATELRLATTGKNFRSTMLDLAVAFGIPRARGPNAASDTTAVAERGERALGDDDVEGWVAREKEAVTTHLRALLRPDPEVLDPLRVLSRHVALAAVSSSACSRLAACLEATGLDRLFPESHRFSAEDSLPRPQSKPDPAIYRFAGSSLGVTGCQGLAVEDSVVGARSAIAAGYATIGNLQFVPPAERAARSHALREVGVVAIISSWWELAWALQDSPPTSTPAMMNQDEGQSRPNIPA
jgi:beta-phosphoglucomutase-like phosphatase (HAD superfamily)